MGKIEIIWEDGDLLICRKPAGLATQTRKLGQPDMESLLKNQRAAKGEAPYIGIVHRLDQPVEGVMVFAKNQRATAELSRQIQNRQIGKHYYAVGRRANGADGLQKKEGTLIDYMVWDGRSNVAQIVPKDVSQAKKAVLEYRVVADKPEEEMVLFDVTLETGRHHQIRLQMSHLGYPLVGDRKYGSPDRLPLALCSYRIELEHPMTGKALEFEIQPQNPVITGMLEESGRNR